MEEQESPQNQQQQNKKRNLSPSSSNTTKKSRKDFQIVPNAGSTEIQEELKRKKLKIPLMNTRVERNKVEDLLTKAPIEIFYEC